jgi:2-polyprenyl-3-methyl-5-hydroxy-6-metoxy-1,4-benzoquinol methylase
MNPEANPAEPDKALYAGIISAKSVNNSATETNQHAQWKTVKDLMGNREVVLGRHVSYWFSTTPRRSLYSMAYYKFASKMIGQKKKVLDIGCGEGLGTWLLAKECGNAIGLDQDNEAILAASMNWKEPCIKFVCDDFLSCAFDAQFDAVVNFDVVEHIYPEHAKGFIDKIAGSLAPHGIAVIGTPSLVSQNYASEIAKSGHVNVYDYDRLFEEMSRRFVHVFMFCANDEVIHTGYSNLAHYYIAVCCKVR